jgi:hypothetical protein
VVPGQGGRLGAGQQERARGPGHLLQGAPHTVQDRAGQAGAQLGGQRTPGGARRLAQAQTGRLLEQLHRGDVALHADHLPEEARLSHAHELVQGRLAHRTQPGQGAGRHHHEGSAHRSLTR